MNALTTTAAAAARPLPPLEPQPDQPNNSSLHQLLFRKNLPGLLRTRELNGRVAHSAPFAKRRAWADYRNALNELIECGLTQIATRVLLNAGRDPRNAFSTPFGSALKTAVSKKNIVILVRLLQAAAAECPPEELAELLQNTFSSCRADEFFVPGDNPPETQRMGTGLEALILCVQATPREKLAAKLRKKDLNQFVHDFLDSEPSIPLHKRLVFFPPTPDIDSAAVTEELTRAIDNGWIDAIEAFLRVLPDCGVAGEALFIQSLEKKKEKTALCILHCVLSEIPTNRVGNFFQKLFNHCLDKCSNTATIEFLKFMGTALPPHLLAEFLVEGLQALAKRSIQQTLFNDPLHALLQFAAGAVSPATLANILQKSLEPGTYMDLLSISSILFFAQNNTALNTSDLSRILKQGMDAAILSGELSFLNHLLPYCNKRVFSPAEQGDIFQHLLNTFAVSKFFAGSQALFLFLKNQLPVEDLGRMVRGAIDTALDSGNITTASEFLVLAKQAELPLANLAPALKKGFATSVQQEDFLIAGVFFQLFLDAEVSREDSTLILTFILEEELARALDATRFRAVLSICTFADDHHLLLISPSPSLLEKVIEVALDQKDVSTALSILESKYAWGLPLTNLLPLVEKGMTVVLETRADLSLLQCFFVLAKDARTPQESLSRLLQKITETFLDRRSPDEVLSLLKLAFQNHPSLIEFFPVFARAMALPAADSNTFFELLDLAHRGGVSRENLSRLLQGKLERSTAFELSNTLDLYIRKLPMEFLFDLLQEVLNQFIRDGKTDDIYSLLFYLSRKCHALPFLEEHRNRLLLGGIQTAFACSSVHAMGALYEQILFRPANFSVRAWQIALEHAPNAAVQYFLEKMNQRTSLFPSFFENLLFAAIREGQAAVVKHLLESALNNPSLHATLHAASRIALPIPTNPAEEIANDTIAALLRSTEIKLLELQRRRKTVLVVAASALLLLIANIVLVMRRLGTR